MNKRKEYVIDEDIVRDVLLIIKTSKTGFSFNELLPLIQRIESLPLLIEEADSPTVDTKESQIIEKAKYPHGQKVKSST